MSAKSDVNLQNQRKRESKSHDNIDNELKYMPADLAEVAMRNHEMKKQGERNQHIWDAFKFTDELV